MTKQFDVAVIGGGPAGYVAAIRAAQLGLNTVCCESNAYADPKGEPRLGGTCLNVGCIPSKAILRSSELFEEANHSFATHGIQVEGNVKMDVATMMSRKNTIVGQLTQGIKGLFKKNKVTFIPGHGSFVAQKDGQWLLKLGNEEVLAKHVIVATGSKARHLPGIAVDNKLICDNEGALDFDAAPKKLGVIGAGVIGLEMGSVWKRLGTEVTILEAAPEFLAAADTAIAKEAAKVFQKQKLNIQVGIQIKEVTTSKNGVKVTYSSKDGDQVLECDKLIVSVGRVPNTDGLNADAVGLKIDDRGRIVVDDHCATNLPNVWAAGDVVRGPMLAHKGMEEGVMIAERIVGQAGHVNYDAIPWVIYTHPEIAWVGKTEQELKAEGTPYRAGQIPFMANGRALGQGDPTGFVRMYAHAETDRIVGVHIIGANASELISEAVVAMEFGAASEDIARICHAHPTLSEVMHEAALAVDKRPLHF